MTTGRMPPKRTLSDDDVPRLCRAHEVLHSSADQRANSRKIFQANISRNTHGILPFPGSSREREEPGANDNYCEPRKPRAAYALRFVGKIAIASISISSSGPAENRLNARGGRQRVQSRFLEELRAQFVELGVIAFDVAQVAGGAHHVFPGGAFRRQQAGDVPVGAQGLRAEIADMDRNAVFIDAGGAGNQQDGHAIDIQAHALEKTRTVSHTCRLRSAPLALR